MGIKSKSSFLVMTFSVVGVVLYVAMFSNILSGLEVIRTYTNIATFTALETVVDISATVLLIGGVFAASFGYYKGYKGASAQDSGGVLRMVFGIVQIILFVSLFYTILTGFYTLYSADNASEYTAFQTVVAIGPTVLFLAGIFGGVQTSVSGIRARRGRRRAMLS